MKRTSILRFGAAGNVGLASIIGNESRYILDKLVRAGVVSTVSVEEILRKGKATKSYRFLAIQAQLSKQDAPVAATGFLRRTVQNVLNRQVNVVPSAQTGNLDTVGKT